MNTASAAAYLQISQKTLANYRSRGIGPVIVKKGRIFYFKEELDEWMTEDKCQSTQQARLKNKSRECKDEIN